MSKFSKELTEEVYNFFGRKGIQLPKKRKDDLNRMIEDFLNEYASNIKD